MGIHENSTSSFETSSLDDDSAVLDKEESNNCQNENDTLEFVFQELPDVTFVVDGIKFPCHLKILAKECTILRDFVSANGVQQQLSKKQRRIAKARQGMCKLSLPSTTTVVELQNIEHKIFRAMLEFLYSGELPAEFYWDQDDTPALEEESSKEDDDPSGESRDRSLHHAMGFLQRLLIAADRYDMVSLKHEVEYKLYDEFLYSFTSAELFVWGDSHSCAFLKEKAMDRICKKNGLIDNFVISNDGWTMIRQSKRLLEELFLHARYAPYGGNNINNDDDESGYEIDEVNYYKVEYLRSRLSQLGLDIDGTRKMLEERLRPHLDANHRRFLPTKLTRLLSQRTLQEQQIHVKSIICCSLNKQQSTSPCSE